MLALWKRPNQGPNQETAEAKGSLRSTGLAWGYCVLVYSWGIVFVILVEPWTGYEWENGSQCQFLLIFFLYKGLLAICHAPWSPTVTWVCFLTVSLPRCFHHPLFIILFWPVCCTCVLLNCFMHLELFVKLWTVVFLPQEICLSLLYEEIWLCSSLLGSVALQSEVCTHEYQSECLSKSPE